MILVPEACTRIDSKAFALCPDLKFVVLPEKAEGEAVQIEEDAFEGSDPAVLYAVAP